MYYTAELLWFGHFQNLTVAALCTWFCSVVAIVAGYNQDRFYIHCDGALFGMMMPFIKEVRRLPQLGVQTNRIGWAPYISCGIVQCFQECVSHKPRMV